MAIALVTSVAAQSLIGLTVTTAGVDTTGANGIFCVTSQYLNSQAPTDSKSNTYTLVAVYGSTFKVSIYACFSPSVGSSHTFTLTFVGTTYPAIAAMAFSGLLTSSGQDGSATGQADQTVDNIQPGSITASAADVFITGFSYNATPAPSINSSFVIPSGLTLPTSAGAALGIGAAYKFSSGAENPTWSTGASDLRSVIMAAFKPSAGGSLFGRSSLDGLSTSGPKQFPRVGT